MHRGSHVKPTLTGSGHKVNAVIYKVMAINIIPIRALNECTETTGF